MLDRRLTGGLAWAGLILILAVPSAEILTAGDKGEAARRVATDPVETASISQDTKDAVDQLLSSGKPMPDYITDGVVADTPRQIPATGAAVPVVTKPKPAAPVQTAALPQKPVAAAPQPMPASMRPIMPVAAPAPAPIADAPLVLDEQEVLAREAAVAPVVVVPQTFEEPESFESSPSFVSGEELEEWDSGSLADYLERRGLMTSDNQSSASFVEDEDVEFSDGTIERRRRGVPDDSFVIFPVN